jgi:hypothetical protein
MPVKKFNTAVEAMMAISDIGRRSNEIHLDEKNEFKVKIRSLGAQDETDSFVDCMNYWGQAFLYKHKIETLVRAITHVNELPIEDVSFSTKRTLIGSWSQVLVDQLYMEYAKLIGSVDDFLEKIKLTAQTNVVGVRDSEKKQETEKESDSNEERKDE